MESEKRDRPHHINQDFFLNSMEIRFTSICNYIYVTKEFIQPLKLKIQYTIKK